VVLWIDVSVASFATHLFVLSGAWALPWAAIWNKGCN